MIRDQFLAGLERALEVARSDPFEHKMKSDAIAIKTLLQVVVHDSYHIGQINLLKRHLLLESKAHPGG